MTPELIAILAVGVAVAGLILNGQTRMDRRLDAFELQVNQSLERLEGRIDALEGRIGSLEQRMSAIEQRLARLEGVLDGLREALFSTRAS